MPCDHQFLIRRDNPYGDGAARSRNYGSMRGVRCGIQPDADEFQSATDPRANLGSVFADAPCEHESIQTSKGSCIGSDEFPRLITKHRYGLRAVRIRRFAFEQVAHVGAIT